jgi:hypothetical protein
MRSAIHTQSAQLDLGRLHAAIEADGPLELERPLLTPVPERLDRAIAAARAREAFCAELVAQRRRVGLTLEAVAEATKINPALFAELERGSLAHWPPGIYRRSFFRDYVSAVGLPVEETMTTFLELFPDAGTPPSAHAVVSTLGRQPLRLTMAPEHHRPAWTWRPALFAAASVDGLGVVALSAAVSWGLSLGFAPTLALVTLGYSLVTTACLGRSLASWWTERGVLLRRDAHFRTALRAVSSNPPDES